MITWLSVVILLVMWSLPAPVLGGSNQVDLDGKGLSHISPSGQEAIRTGRQVQDSLGAQQGRKSMEELKKKQRQNQEEMSRAWDHMNNGKDLQNPWKTSKPDQKSPASTGKKCDSKKGKSWQINHR